VPRNASRSVQLQKTERAEPEPAASDAAFDYDSAAELFPTRMRKGWRQPLTYRRFARAADAIQFAVETLPPAVLLGTYLQVEEQRFAGHAIRRLYDSSDYPLTRPDGKPSQ
jgi:hypothetical protein